jgi:hypothetical protein
LKQDLKIGPADVVATSQWVSLGARLNHQREIYWEGIAEFDSRAGELPPTDATVAIGPWKSRNKDDWDGAKFGWVRVVYDPNHEWALWLRPGDPRLTGGISKGNGS